MIMTIWKKILIYLNWRWCLSSHMTFQEKKWFVIWKMKTVLCV